MVMHSQLNFKHPLLLTAVLGCLLFACSKVEDYRDPVSNDTTKPGVISNIKVTNFNGGAFITYSLPQAENLL